MRWNGFSSLRICRGIYRISNKGFEFESTIESLRIFDFRVRERISDCMIRKLRFWKGLVEIFGDNRGVSTLDSKMEERGARVEIRRVSVVMIRLSGFYPIRPDIHSNPKSRPEWLFNIIRNRIEPL